jgi:hypothetical protein
MYFSSSGPFILVPNVVQKEIASEIMLLTTESSLMREKIEARDQREKKRKMMSDAKEEKKLKRKCT